ncbi:MAG: ferredoxin [Thermoprotei archaeon]|nr:MAG: ferredoxin [Thermoprotei archaeon]
MDDLEVEKVEVKPEEVEKAPVEKFVSYRSLMRKVFYIDVERCIGCKSCEAACARVHGGSPRMYVQTIVEFNVPMHCQHCEVSACVEACPEQAIEKTPEGFTILDEAKCVGCKACVVACPFGMLRLDEERKVVVKCDMCIDRIKQGLQPACVATCTAEALKFIDCIGCNICVVSCPFAKKRRVGGSSAL